MRNVVIFLLIALTVAGGYGYKKSPQACQKLGQDVVSDVTTIFGPSESAKPTDEGTSDTTAASSSAPVVSPAPPAPVLAPAPQHYSMGYVAPSAAPAPAPLPTTQTAPSSAPQAAPLSPASAQTPPANVTANNLLGNGDFTTGDALWEGDGRVDLHFGRSLVVPLSSDSWTKVAQDFKGDKGTVYTIKIQYKVTADLSTSTDVPDYTNVIDHVRFEDYKNYPDFSAPLGTFLVWIGDLNSTGVGQARSEMFLLKPASDTQTYEHSFAASPAFADKMVTLAFPPGTGSVILLHVAVTSSQ